MQFVPQLGINSTFNASTGVLTLYGNANYGVWETVLQTVCYKSLVPNNSNVNATKNVVIVLGDALYNPANGHFYKLVNNPPSTDWTDAKIKSSQSNYFGLQGYLVTITSPQEDNFISSFFTENVWIGASDSVVEGEWRWVTGCEGMEDGGQGRLFWLGNAAGSSVGGNYSNWYAGNPSNTANEDVANKLYPFGYTWNDANWATPYAYVIEYGCMPGDPIVNITGNATINLLTTSDTIINHTMCQGDTFLNHYTSGTWTDTFTSASGCDSLRILNLVANPCCADSNYVLNQTATGPVSDVFTLTVNAASQAGNVTSKKQFNLNQTFDESFTLNFGCNDGNGADGISIILHDQGLNYNSIASDAVGANLNPDQLKIEFDTYENNSPASSVLGDPWYDHVAIMKDGAKDHNGSGNLFGPVQASVLDPNIEDCNNHIVRVRWNPQFDSLRVYFDGALRIEAQYDILTNIFSSSPIIYVSVSGATGGLGNVQSVSADIFSSDYVLTTINHTICQGQSYMGYTTTTSWSDTLTSVSGCDKSQFNRKSIAECYSFGYQCNMYRSTTSDT